MEADELCGCVEYEEVGCHKGLHERYLLLFFISHNIFFNPVYKIITSFPVSFGTLNY